MGGELAFLWHLHQPPYRDPGTGVYQLPWVRLHATRGYLDLAEIHRRHPKVHSTVNFSPILLEQLEDYAEGRAKDRFLNVAMTPAEELSEDERIFLLDRFFMVSWERGVRPFPRYWELLQKRGETIGKEDLPRIAIAFGAAELRDLQVLFHLAWMGFAARAKSEGIAALIEKGRDFSEEDKELLFHETNRLVQMVIPMWRELSDAGSVELSCSPYAHPILPLLCDSDSARVALPKAALPPRLLAREDAELQVRRGREVHERVFGSKPRGMWPSEGSVSPEALEVMRLEGVEWTASDEEVLYRSLREGADASLIYYPWKVRAGEGELQMVFRDRRLSDRIGFTYARAPEKDAVDDLLGEVSRIAAGFRSDQALVPVILDGENPWEYYPGSGEAFLTELFTRLEAKEQGIGTLTIGEAMDRELPSWTLDRIHPGSWIEGSFRIWMGHSEDVAAWVLVGQAKEAIERARREGEDAETIAAAQGHLLLAEASDWFWWYGEDFLSETRTDFDLLFRHFIQATFTALGLPPPETSFHPLIPEGRSFGEALVAKQPAGFVRPKVDGLLPSYWEWLGAGLYVATKSLGQSMYQGGGIFERLYFGFDPKTLYLRMDPSGGAAGMAVHPDLDGIALEIRVEGKIVELQGALSGSEFRFEEEGALLGRGCARKILELEFPFASLGLRAGQRIGLAVRALQGKLELQRLPEQGFLIIEIPGESFEETLWKV